MKNLILSVMALLTLSFASSAFASGYLEDPAYVANMIKNGGVQSCIQSVERRYMANLDVTRIEDLGSGYPRFKLSGVLMNPVHYAVGVVEITIEQGITILPGYVFFCQVTYEDQIVPLPTPVPNKPSIELNEGN